MYTVADLVISLSLPLLPRLLSLLLPLLPLLSLLALPLLVIIPPLFLPVHPAIVIWKLREMVRYSIGDERPPFNARFLDCVT